MLGLKMAQDILAQAAFGWTKEDAHAAGVCIDCRLAPKPRSEADVGEYRISGLCPDCFEKATRPRKHFDIIDPDEPPPSDEGDDGLWDSEAHADQQWDDIRSNE